MDVSTLMSPGHIAPHESLTRLAADGDAVYHQAYPNNMLTNEEIRMSYRVHQLEVKKDTAQEKLERFLNQLHGEVLSVVPYVAPTFKGMGATAEVDFLLIVEKVE